MSSIGFFPELYLIYQLIKTPAAAEPSHAKKSGGIPSGAATAYIKKYFPLAQQTEKFYSVPALVTLSQGGLESGWETSHIVKNSNNHFGIKADPSWHGPVFQGYRSYPDAQSSFDDHAKYLVKNPRYKKAFATSDPITFAREIAAAKYSENPKYADIILQVMQTIQKSV